MERRKYNQLNHSNRNKLLVHKYFSFDNVRNDTCDDVNIGMPYYHLRIEQILL